MAGWRLRSAGAGLQSGALARAPCLGKGRSSVACAAEAGKCSASQTARAAPQDDAEPRQLEPARACAGPRGRRGRSGTGLRSSQAVSARVAFEGDAFDANWRSWLDSSPAGRICTAGMSGRGRPGAKRGSTPPASRGAWEGACQGRGVAMLRRCGGHRHPGSASWLGILADILAWHLGLAS